ncbi:MAG: polyprenyl synthetase family protein [Parachlamydiales bacterium]|nr:polyprenyl synthetase family protein [Parachlamydiales bacterium]
MAIELYRSQIEKELVRSIELLGEKNGLRDACEYALLNGGKRLRPMIVLMIADALGKGADAMPAALSVEFFHTASLIADDLPCMDNDDFRRNRPSLHKAFGESAAILASYALIAEGYGGIYRNSKSYPEGAVICLEAATRCAGINGATGGQFFDLYPPGYSLEAVQKIIYQKTVTLFEISFIFGWVFGGGDLKRLDEIKLCAYHLGLAFQTADDLIDGSQDSRINMAIAVGVEKAEQIFTSELEAFIESLKKLGLWNEGFQELVEYLSNYRYCTH